MKSFVIILSLLSLSFTFQALSSEKFEIRNTDIRIDEECGRCPYIRKISCNNLQYAILYYHGGFDYKPPKIIGICKWENANNIFKCEHEIHHVALDQEILKCWNRVQKKYGLPISENISSKVEDLYNY